MCNSHPTRGTATRNVSKVRPPLRLRTDLRSYVIPYVCVRSLCRVPRNYETRELYLVFLTMTRFMLAASDFASPSRRGREPRPARGWAAPAHETTLRTPIKRES